jgi:RNA polymerase sigma-70 factor, ECF subfamily
MNNPENNSCCDNVPSPCGQVAPVFLAYEDKLRGFIRKQVRDPDTAREITQQLFLKLYQSCEQLPKVKNLKAWLYQVTRNAIVDYFRSNKLVISLDADEPVTPETDGALAKEILELVEPMLSLLPEEYARPLYLSDIQGVPQKEIAERLGLSLSGTKSRIQRGREKLKTLFIECCHLELDRNGQIMQAQVREDCQPLQQLLNKS